MVDGIDGSGKRTIIESMMRLMNPDQTLPIFDIGEWSKEHHTLPDQEDIGDAKLVIGVEPSYVWTGAAIRYEMIKNGNGYHPRDIAAALSHDRLVIYKRCYLPLLEKGITIIAERGVSSSIAFQPAQDPTITIEELLSLTGNSLAMQHVPDHLVIASINPAIALSRLQKRNNKQDDAIFEKKSIMQTLHERYHSDWFKKLFEDRGTKVYFIDTSGSKEEVHEKIKIFITNL